MAANHGGGKSGLNGVIIRGEMLLVALALALSGCDSRAPQVSLPPLSFTTSEQELRSFVTTAIRPSFPQDALREKKTGVAVVEIKLFETGRVQEVKVLEAPSRSIAVSVAQSVSRWRFQPTIGDATQPSARFGGKLTFYFLIQHKHGVVLYPSEAAYVGRWGGPSEIAGKT